MTYRCREDALWIDQDGTKQVRDHLDNHVATSKWDVEIGRFLITAVRRFMKQGIKVVFEEEHSYIDNRDG